MTAPLIGVLALQGDFREHLALVQACGARVRRVRRPDDLLGLDGIILPGGESTTISKLSQAFGIIEPLTSAIADGLPAYGSCAGLILLARRVIDQPGGHLGVGGLDIVVRRNAFGRQIESFETAVPVAGIPGGPVHAVFIRAPWVEEAGDDVRVLAVVTPPGLGSPRAVAVQQGSVLATAFHPEVTADLRVHHHFLRLVAKQ